MNDDGARQINRLLICSLVITVLLITPTLVPFLGSTSLWLTPIGIILTIIHNGIVLGRTSRSRQVEHVGLPTTASLGTIICAFLLAVLFLAAMGLDITILVGYSLRFGRSFPPALAATIIEVLMLAVEVALLLTIGAKCTAQRRVVAKPMAATRFAGTV